MRHLFLLASSAMVISAALVGGAAAQPLHHTSHHHARAGFAYRAHHRSPYYAYAGRPMYVQRGVGAENPAYGYEEAPYDPAYVGPGATVFNATRRAAQEPGVTNELSPYAKETATGGPSGGVPGFDGS